MSLYAVQKLLYQLNRDPRIREQFQQAPQQLLENYSLTAEERAAIEAPDIGLLYVLGVNGQLLMHYAALSGYAWPEYIQSMRDGIEQHGPVRAGLYSMTDGQGAV
ncbi:MAG: aromatic ring-opening dioxygenase subunit LigA [Burkholderiaceae bacterium]